MKNNSKAASIIVVEDEPKIAQILVDYLTPEGHSVTIIDDGSEAVEQIIKSDPDLVLLDVMLPGKDGLAICKELRETSNIPIIMLTAKVDEIDRLLGLGLGADDYVCKPFSPREVVMRVASILRRVQSSPVTKNDQVLAYRNVLVNLERHQCTVNDIKIVLTPVELNMLKTMMAQAGRVFSREQLMNASYSDNRIVSDRTIDSHMKNLRKKLSVHLEGEELIHSIYGVGYKIE